MRGAGDAQTRDELARILTYLVAGDAFDAVQNLTDGTEMWNELEHAYGTTSDDRGARATLDDIMALSFNDHPSPQLLGAEVRRLKALYHRGASDGTRDDGLIVSALIAALKLPHAPASFRPLHGHLLFLRSPTVSEIVKLLTEFYDDHREELAGVSAVGLLAAPPAPPRPTTVAEPEKTWCTVCYGVGHAAGDCASDPKVTANVCAFCCKAGHPTSMCNSKPSHWSLGRVNRHPRVGDRHNDRRDGARGGDRRDSQRGGGDRRDDAHGGDRRDGDQRGGARGDGWRDSRADAHIRAAFDFSGIDSVSWMARAVVPRDVPVPLANGARRFFLDSGSQAHILPDPTAFSVVGRTAPDGTRGRPTSIGDGGDRAHAVSFVAPYCAPVPDAATGGLPVRVLISDVCCAPTWAAPVLSVGVLRRTASACVRLDGDEPAVWFGDVRCPVVQWDDLFLIDLIDDAPVVDAVRASFVPARVLTALYTVPAPPPLLAANDSRRSPSPLARGLDLSDAASAHAVFGLVGQRATNATLAAYGHPAPRSGPRRPCGRRCSCLPHCRHKTRGRFFSSAAGPARWVDF